MDTFFGTSNLIYWSLIIVTIFLTTKYIGPLWRRHESARWTLGYFVVFFYGFWMVLFGGWDGNTYLALFFAVGLSGVIKVGYELWHTSREAQAIRDRAGEIVAGIVERLKGGADEPQQRR